MSNQTEIQAAVRVRGASENNLRNVDVEIPRDALVAFTGISGSGKSSLAFGTLYAEAQRRYFESVAPYARRLLAQVGAPRVQEITGLPPAVALQQRGGSPSSRSTVGTITTLSNLLRLLFSRAGEYPDGAEHLEAESFSPNTVAGACPRCHGLGSAHDVVEDLMVPDTSLSIREGAIAAWPGAWQGANLRSIATSSVNDNALVCAMLRPRKVTVSDSARSPVPWQAGHWTLRTKRIALSRIIWLFEVARTWWTCARALQKSPW